MDDHMFTDITFYLELPAPCTSLSRPATTLIRALILCGMILFPFLVPRIYSFFALPQGYKGISNEDWVRVCNGPWRLCEFVANQLPIQGAEPVESSAGQR